jgi:hypothetical protein
MGFDYLKIPILHRSLETHSLPLVSFFFRDVVAGSNDTSFNHSIADFKGSLLGFLPHFGWEGHIEITEKSNETGSIT